MPKKFILDYNKPREFKNENHLHEYTSHVTNSLIPGDGALVLDDNLQVSGLQQQHYIWNKYKWVKIGAPQIKEYLNIYHIDLITDSNGIEIPYATFFMRVQLRNIQSNIRLLSMLNKNYIINNNEIMTFMGLHGLYNLNNNLTNNVISAMISLNLTNSMDLLLKSLCNQFNVPSLRFNEFIQVTIQSLNKIVLDTAYIFTQIYNNFINIDLSQYTHYIASCFASFEKIFKVYYNNNIVMPILDPMDSLSVIDIPLLNRLRVSNDINNEFTRILTSIDDILYRRTTSSGPSLKNPYRYYEELNKLISYFISNNDKLRTQQAYRDNFLMLLNEGIGGLINLALMFAILSNTNQNTRSVLYFHFIAPRKYQYIY